MMRQEHVFKRIPKLETAKKVAAGFILAATFSITVCSNVNVHAASGDFIDEAAQTMMEAGENAMSSLSKEAPTGLAGHKEKILEAMDILRGWGWSPIDITNKIFGRGKSEDIKEAGSQLWEDAKGEVQKQSESIMEDAKESLEEKAQDAAKDFVSDLFSGD